MEVPTLVRKAANEPVTLTCPECNKETYVGGEVTDFKTYEHVAGLIPEGAIWWFKKPFTCLACGASGMAHATLVDRHKLSSEALALVKLAMFKASMEEPPVKK